MPESRVFCTLPRVADISKSNFNVTFKNIFSLSLPKMKRVHETKYIGNDFSRTVLFSRMLN
jgi:hypothetical protein